jgi:ribosome-binding factor A
MAARNGRPWRQKAFCPFCLTSISTNMPAGSRPSRVGDQLRAELSDLLAREVHDPGIGFLTITHVKVSPDLQLARVYYTTLGTADARRDSGRALERAAPFLRRQLGSRLRLKRVPQLEFFFDESIERGDRIEQILQDLQATRDAGERDTPDGEQTRRDERDHDE